MWVHDCTKSVKGHQNNVVSTETRQNKLIINISFAHQATKGVQLNGLENVSEKFSNYNKVINDSCDGQIETGGHFSVVLHTHNKK